MQFDDTVDVVEGLCQNISIGGMLVQMDDPRPQGSLVRFELVVEDGLSIRGLGEVIWSRARAAPGRESGIGVKFRFLEQRDRQLILKLVSQHIKERLERKHPGLDDEPADDMMSPSGKVPASIAAAAAAARQKAAEASGKVSAGVAEAARREAEPVDPLDGPVPVGTQPFPAPDEVAEMLRKPSGVPPSIAAAAAAARGEHVDDDEDLRGTADLPPLDQIGAGLYREDGVSRPAHGAGDLALHDDDEDFDDEPEFSPAPYMPPQRRRATRRRDFPILPVAAVLLLVAVAGVFLYREQIFGPSAPPVEPPGPTAQNPPADGTPGELPIDEPPPLSVDTASTDPGSADPGSANTPPPPRTTPPPPPPASTRPFRQVRDIRWSRLPGGLKIEIIADGVIPQNRVKHLRLDGDNVREVIRLLGVAKRYSKKQIDIPGASVERIRVGWHNDSEVHLVLDMRDQTSRAKVGKPNGNVLTIVVN